MANYRVMSWRGIPTQVKASDDTGDVAAIVATEVAEAWRRENGRG